MQNTQQVVQDEIVQQEQAKQTKSIMTMSMLVAGIGFVVTCLVGYIFSYAFSWAATQENWESWFDILMGIAIFGLVFSLVLSTIWRIRREKWSIKASIILITIFVISNGIGFGSLFFLLHVKEIMIIFGMTGFILLGTYGLSKLMSTKAALTLWKVATALLLTYSIAMGIVCCATYFTIGIGKNIGGLIVIAVAISGFASVLYLTYYFWRINKYETEIKDETLRKKIALFYGFYILVNVLKIIWVLAYILLKSKDDKEEKEKEEKKEQIKKEWKDKSNNDWKYKSKNKSSDLSSWN